MKRRTKKLFSLLLSLALVVGMIPAFGVTASAEDPLIWWEGTTICIRYDGSVDECTLTGYYKMPELSKEQIAFNVTLELDSTDKSAYDWINRSTFKNSFTIKDGVVRYEGFSNSAHNYGSVGFKTDSNAECHVVLLYGDKTYSTETVKVKDLYAGYNSLDPKEPEIPTVNITGPIHVQIKDIIAGEKPDFSVTQDNKYCTINNNGKQTVTYMIDGTTMMQSSWTFSSDHYYRVWANFSGSVIDGKQYVFPSNLKVYINGKETTFKSYGKTATAYCDFTPISNNPQTHTVTFNANGGSGSMPDMTVADGGWLKFPECTFTPPAGATFAGWKLSYRDSVYDPGNSVTIYQDTIYYAIWKGGSVVSNDFDTHYVNTGALNMRAKPDTGSERIGGLKKGDLVMLLDSDGEWFQISYRGLIGWVQNKYLDRVIGGWEYPFTDITEGTFDYVPILWAYNAKPQVTNGITSTRFGPKETVTRGQCVTFLWRAMGEPEPKSKYNPFVDVPESQYYYKPILWAVEKGITKGTDKNHFSPDQKLSTAHIITFLYRTLGKGSDGWYQEAGNWASSNGLLDRTGLTVSPDVECPRGAVVTFLYRTK